MPFFRPVEAALKRLIPIPPRKKLSRSHGHSVPPERAASHAQIVARQNASACISVRPVPEPQALLTGLMPSCHGASICHRCWRRSRRGTVPGAGGRNLFTAAGVEDVSSSFCLLPDADDPCALVDCDVAGLATAGLEETLRLHRSSRAFNAASKSLLSRTCPTASNTPGSSNSVGSGAALSPNLSRKQLDIQPLFFLQGAPFAPTPRIRPFLFLAGLLPARTLNRPAG